MDEVRSLMMTVIIIIVITFLCVLGNVTNVVLNFQRERNNEEFSSVYIKKSSRWNPVFVTKKKSTINEKSLTSIIFCVFFSIFGGVCVSLFFWQMSWHRKIRIFMCQRETSNDPNVRNPLRSVIFSLIQLKISTDKFDALLVM